MKIHSNFKFKKYTFRQIIMPNSIGVIAEGRVKTKGLNGGLHEIEKFGVLLPSLVYEVTTASLEVMHVASNESLIMKVSGQLFKERQRDKENTPQTIHFPSFKEKHRSHYRSKAADSSTIEMICSKQDRAKREREITRLSKESEHYSIISSFLCHKSLDMIKQQNIINKSKERREDRCRNPLILFNIINEKSRLATPNFPNATRVSTTKEESPYAGRAKKITSEFKTGSNERLLKKLKLPLRDYKRMVMKRDAEDKKILTRGDSKVNILMAFNYAKKHTFDSRME